MNPVQFLVTFLTCVFLFAVFTLAFVEYLRWRFKNPLEGNAGRMSNIAIAVIASIAYLAIGFRLTILFLFGM